MIGMIVWIPAEQRKLGVTERRVMHMSFLCVQIPRGPRTPEWMLRRRIRWAAAKLHRLGNQTGGAAGGLSLAGLAGKEGASDGGEPPACAAAWR